VTSLLHLHTDIQIGTTSIRHWLGERTTPRWDTEDEDDVAEEVGNKGVRVFPSWCPLFISKLWWALASYRSK
jgi:hypothetical protein